MRKVFVLLARCTSGNVISDPGLHSFPDQMVLGLSESLVPSRMSCGGVIMDQGHQIPFLHFGGHRYGYLANTFCWREDSCVSIVPLALVNVQGSRQDVWTSVRLSRDIVNLEIVFL